MRTAQARFLWMLAAILPALFVASPALAQYRDEYGDVRQTVARIAFVDGSVSFARGDDPDNWQPADRNVPMTIGDRVYTGSRSRLELQVEGGDSVRLGAQTDLAALNLTDDTKQFSVNAGIASFLVRRLDDNDVFEIDTPNSAITVEQPGDYRVDVDPDGNTRVVVRRGRVTVAAGGGQVHLRTGEEMDVDGIDNPRYDVVSAGSIDGWDRWVTQRDSRLTHAQSLQYVSAGVVGTDDLDQYGRWEQIPDYGRVWTPTAVAVDWAPYRVGHWIWQDPWGWTWVSAEPWGWAPYHYGRWVVSSSRWYWVPVAPAAVVAYSPALVAFVGGGPGFSASITIGGGGFVGWFPLGPRDPLNSWWDRRASANVNITNVTYVNRTYVTVVNQNTFVSGGVVTNAVVSDRTVLRQVVAAPVVRGALPVVPTAGSLHVAVRADAVAAARPPAQIAARSVVARVAPPPAPPTFQAKLAVIRENRGAPVAPADAARISVENRGRAQTVTNVRPVAAESGKMTLAPRGRAAEASSASRPEPISAGPVRGRPVATTQQPVASAPVTSSNPPARGPASREIAPRAAPQQAPAAQQPAPPIGRERQGLATPPPAERQIQPPPERSVPPSGERGRTSTQQNESWRNRQNPADATPRAGPPMERTAPQPGERGRQRVTPPAERPTPPSESGRQSVASPAERPAGQPPRGREAVVTPERPQPPREARPQPQSERQVERPAPQKSPKKEEKGKEKQKTPKPDDRERKPE